MNYTFKLKKEDNLYLCEFIEELLRVYKSVNISQDEECYYLTLFEQKFVLKSNGFEFKDEPRYINENTVEVDC